MPHLMMLAGLLVMNNSFAFWTAFGFILTATKLFRCIIFILLLPGYTSGLAGFICFAVERASSALDLQSYTLTWHCPASSADWKSFFAHTRFPELGCGNRYGLVQQLFCFICHRISNSTVVAKTAIHRKGLVPPVPGNEPPIIIGQPLCFFCFCNAFKSIGSFQYRGSCWMAFPMRIPLLLQIFHFVQSWPSSQVATSRRRFF